MTSLPEPPRCGLCGEPMPAGEEMFNYHGYSGPCPKPPKASPEPPGLDALRREAHVTWVLLPQWMLLNPGGPDPRALKAALTYGNAREALGRALGRAEGAAEAATETLNEMLAQEYRRGRVKGAVERGLLCAAIESALDDFREVGFAAENDPGRSAEHVMSDVYEVCRRLKKALVPVARDLATEGEGK